MSLDWLYNIILDRKDSPTTSSYTARLFSEGLNNITKKLGEEATEVVIASLAENNQRLIEEIADLTYHLLVLMAYRNITPDDIKDELKRRHR